VGQDGILLAIVNRRRSLAIGTKWPIDNRPLSGGFTHERHRQPRRR